MRDIFLYDSYKQYLHDALQARSQNQKGSLSRMAEHLGVQPSYLSQVLRGNKDVSSEQALKIGEHLGLSEIETDYFLCLLLRERAGSPALKRYYKSKINDLQRRSRKFTIETEQTVELSEADKSIFYTTHHYAQIRILSSIPQYQTVDEISSAVRLPRHKVTQIIQFLVSRGLCVQAGDERISMGPKRTHLDGNSPFIASHHRNWRLQAIHWHSHLDEYDLAFSAPLSISRKDFEKVRNLLKDTIDSIGRTVESSPAEKFAILNVDWIQALKP